MIRVAVIDDEPLARSGIIARLAGYADLGVVAEFADGREGLQGMREAKPDLAFVDVDMPGMNGLDMLAGLAPAERPMAVLLTAHAQFALRAFELNAIDYLLKPINEDRLHEAIERARQALPYRLGLPPAPVRNADLADTFTVRVGNRIVLVATDHITWIGAEGDYASLHANGRQYLLREPIHRLMDKLDPARFFRIHRSTIVRIDQVSEFQYLTNRDGLIRLADGTPLRVSRTYIDGLFQALQTHRRCSI